jgi:branched-chain amino acid transport system ATP-binding protein
MLLEIDNISVRYEKVEAIRGISLEVEDGQIITILGANGAGKSTILRAISGMKKLAAGKILFNSDRIDGWPPRKIVAAGISHVPEGRRIFPYMTVLENLMMGAFLQKSKAKINTTLDIVYSHFAVLRERTLQTAGTLSGGEQQMLAIGRALMSTPRLLLLDEPSLGLSPIMVQEYAEIIKNINQQGVTIVLVEQNVNLALKLAHKGYVMEIGKIALQGDSSSLINNEYVKKAYLGG